MGFAVVVQSGPAAEPVALEGDGGLKQWLRVDWPDDDALITSLAKAARRLIERAYDCALVTQTLQLVLDRFPVPGNPYLYQQYSFGYWASRIPVANLSGSWWPERGAIWVPRPPLLSVTSLQYVAMDGTTQTLVQGADYDVDTARMPGRITPHFGTFWPVQRQQMNAVTITYQAGYGTAGQVPDTVKTAIKVQTAAMYRDRESQDGLTKAAEALLLAEWDGAVW